MPGLYDYVDYGEDAHATEEDVVGKWRMVYYGLMLVGKLSD